jgi:hypothetical protein
MTIVILLIFVASTVMDFVIFRRPSKPGTVSGLVTMQCITIFGLAFGLVPQVFIIACMMVGFYRDAWKESRTDVNPI